jgi:hypothetical protein
MRLPPHPRYERWVFMTRVDFYEYVQRELDSSPWLRQVVQPNNRHPQPQTGFVLSQPTSDPAASI